MMVISTKKVGVNNLKSNTLMWAFLMLKEHVTWSDGGNAVEPGIAEWRDMMLERRFKVFNT